MVNSLRKISRRSCDNDKVVIRYFMLILRIIGTDGDVGTTQPWRIISPVGLGA